MTPTIPRLVLVLGEHFTPDNIPGAAKPLAFPETGLHPRRVPIPASGRVFTHPEMIVDTIAEEIYAGKRRKEDAAIEIHFPDGHCQFVGFGDEGIPQNWPPGFFSR